MDSTSLPVVLDACSSRQSHSESARDGLKRPYALALSATQLSRQVLPGQVHYNTRRMLKKRAAKRTAKVVRKWGAPEALWPTTGECECCGAVPQDKPLCLDHDHETGEFRGWLCASCNSGIGLLGDTEAAVRRALRYLSPRTRTLKRSLRGVKP